MTTECVISETPEHIIGLALGRGFFIAAYDEDYQECLRVSDEFYGTFAEASKASAEGTWTPA
ncbi:hypothetical protein EZJ19_07810 [Parasulfuritortus cantonensis]|uniref:Uncharacterized protein n=1 Tax=Parasulfuritortus cantonensis TaxID=2528202 RepID=A0A4R1BDL8_9PROT|nr:hypothetical protein [Parasulfuritortus cantonensis]TCJ15205.1 hypothetical protein EZJ19_07810 [Parasulfuritortus cantonensis]